MYKYNIVKGFWKYILYINEIYIDFVFIRKKEILKEVGIRYKLENIVEYLLLEGNKIYCGVWVIFDEKVEKLEFYYNEKEYMDKSISDFKFRRCFRIESFEDYEKRVFIWENEKSYFKKVKS